MLFFTNVNETFCYALERVNDNMHLLSGFVGCEKKEVLGFLKDSATNNQLYAVAPTTLHIRALLLANLNNTVSGSE